MSVEVRQLVVRSNVVQRCESDEESGADESKKKDILEECRRMILEILKEMKER